MFTQSLLNNLLERIRILTRLYPGSVTPKTRADIDHFFSKLKATEKITEIPLPDSVEPDRVIQGVKMDWSKVNHEGQLDIVVLEFHGDSGVHLIANYESLDIDVEQRIPFNEEFPELVLTHLKHFKRKIVKKKYK